MRAVIASLVGTLLAVYFLGAVITVAAINEVEERLL